MRAGVTATHHGLTQAQKDRLRYEFAVNMVTTLDLGDCIGGDTDAFHIARDMGRPLWLVGHVPINPRARSFLKYDEEREPLPYLERNKRIVQAGEWMFVLPYEEREQPRGGTWSTYRYTKKIGKPLTLILPNGRVRHE